MGETRKAPLYDYTINKNCDGLRSNVKYIGYEVTGRQRVRGRMCLVTIYDKTLASKGAGLQPTPLQMFSLLSHAISRRDKGVHLI